MENLPSSLIGLCFLRRNNAVYDVSQAILTSPFLSMQPKPDTQITMRQTSPPLDAKNAYTIQPGEILTIASRCLTSWITTQQK